MANSCERLTVLTYYNAHALTTACVQPYKDKYSSEKVSNREFNNKFENKRYETLSVLCYMNTTKINELWSEINRNSLTIFKKPVNSTIENLLLHLKTNGRDILPFTVNIDSTNYLIEIPNVVASPQIKHSHFTGKKKYLRF